MNIPQAIWLGIVQGLTEFLPVSSSGHLVLFQNLLGIHDPMIAFDVAVHLGTMVAVVAFFFKDLWRMIWQTLYFLVRFPCGQARDAFYENYPYAMISGFVILASIPTAVLGLSCQDIFETLFGSVLGVGIAWIFTGVALILSRRINEDTRSLTMMNHRDAFLIGMAQGIAIIPGISRSGATIIGGMLCGIEKKEAARFSFLVALPVILGAGILKLKEGVEIFATNPGVIIAGFVTSAIVGFIAIALLLKIVQRGKLYYFGYYCLAIAVFAIGYSLFSVTIP